MYDSERYAAMTEAEIVRGHGEACQEVFVSVKDRVVSALKAHGDVQEDMDSVQGGTAAEEVDLVVSSDGEQGKEGEGGKHGKKNAAPFYRSLII